MKLVEWFDIEPSIMLQKKEQWFSQHQLNSMAEGKYKEPDYLRDIATLLFYKGDFENADKTITRALELRPNGPAIQALKNKIAEQK